MFRIHTGRIAAALLLLSTSSIPQTALAASYLDAAYKKPKTTYTASLIEMTQTDSLRKTHTLDWRQPSVELTFELPPAQRTSDIILTLSADPLSRVSRKSPLQVQFNNGEIFPIRSNGNGFEAQISLKAGQARAGRNTLRITYPAPAGADCVSPADGAWSIDLAQSSLRISGRANSRHLRLSEITEYLEHAALSPKRIGLIAAGANATDMQALAAQAIALRTPSVPKFSVSKYGTNFNIVMVKRSDLIKVTDDPMLLNSKGPRIFVPRGKPTELIFTADTDAEILEMLKIFATRKLPNTRRPISNIGEMYMQQRLDFDRHNIAGKTKLSDLAIRPVDAQPGEQNYKFNVKDPTSTQGKLMLRVSTTQDIGEDSRLRVSLNGKTLGATKLDKKRKSVAFDIQPGDLNTASNILTLSPDLSAQKAFSCPSINAYDPGYSIGHGSRLTMSQAEGYPVTNLAQLASSGGLFAKSESYIVLPKQTRDFQAALSVLGQIAKASGQGFTLGDYSRTSNVAKDKHILIIGPSSMVKDHLIDAPQAFRAAMLGQATTGQNLLQAKNEQSAGLNSEKSVLKYAAAQSRSFKINRGGVATLYGAGDGRLIGIISSTPGTSFSVVSQNLIQPNHWKALQGGVARWTSSSIVMAQTAQSDIGIRKPEIKSREQWSDFNLSIFEKYDFHLPEMSWPEINLPEFDMPKISLPKFNWRKFQFRQPNTEKKAEISPQENLIPNTKIAELRHVDPIKSAEKIVNIIPRLKPIVKPATPQEDSASSGLRRSFQFAEKKQNHVNSGHGFKRNTQTKWMATQQWFKAKRDAFIKSRTLKEVVISTDRLQDQTKPAGGTLESVVLDKLPAKGIVQLGDRSVSVYGLILIIAFSLILLLMSLASPKSRMGGRH